MFGDLWNSWFYLVLPVRAGSDLFDSDRSVPIFYNSVPDVVLNVFDKAEALTRKYVQDGVKFRISREPERRCPEWEKPFSRIISGENHHRIVAEHFLHERIP
jgi:hypothetical protein